MIICFVCANAATAVNSWTIDDDFGWKGYAKTSDQITDTPDMERPQKSAVFEMNAVQAVTKTTPDVLNTWLKFGLTKVQWKIVQWRNKEHNFCGFCDERWAQPQPNKQHPSVGSASEWTYHARSIEICYSLPWYTYHLFYGRMWTEFFFIRHI